MFGIALSHNGEEDGHPNEIQENHYSTINPMYYIKNDNYMGAIFISLIWIGLSKGIYELSKLLLAKAL
jgi:hypothetical protein